MRSARWLRARDRAGRVLALPNQTPGLLQQVGLTHEQAGASVWTAAPDGSKLAGAAALNRVLREIGGIWRLVSLAYGVPAVRWLEDRAYAWVARNRHRLAGLWGDPPEA